MNKYFILVLLCLLWAASAQFSWGGTRELYVDNSCSTNGDGTSQACTSLPNRPGPFNSIGHMETMVTGDQSDTSVWLKRGQIFREPLVVAANGTAGHPFTIGAYGSGTNPIITPSHLVTGWSLSSGNIYRASYTPSAYDLWQDNTYLTKVTSLGALIAPGEWYDDIGAEVLYAWTLDGSSPAAHTMEAATTAASQKSAVVLSNDRYINIQDLTVEKHSGVSKGLIEASNSSYIVMSRLTVRYGGYQGYGVNFTGGGYNIFQDGLVHDVRNTGIYFKQGSTHDQAIRNTVYNVGQNTDLGDNGAICFGGVNGGADYGLIEKNVVYNVGHSDTISHNHTIEIDRSNYIVVRYNRIHDSVKGGISIGGAPGRHVTDGEVYGNIVYDINMSYGSHSGEAPGILIFNGGRITVYNNVVWNIGTSGYSDESLLVDGSSGEILDSIATFNNIIGPSFGRYRRHWQNGANATYINRTSNNNLFYDPAGLVLYNGMAFYTTLTAYQAVVRPQEGMSLNDDPRFANAAAGDFTLLTSSPAINAGAKLGSPYSWELLPGSLWPGSVATGNEDLYGSGWEIGAYISMY